MRNARQRDSLQLNHSQVQPLLLDYSYGRLSRATDAAVEAHVARCQECRAEGVRHVATERVRAVQQRARKQRRSPVRGLAVMASILLGALVGLSIFFVVGSARAEQRAHNQSLATPTDAPFTQPSHTPGPATLHALGSIPARDVAALAWSPDGAILATASTPQGSDPGGVLLFTQGPTGNLTKRLSGFEHYPPPGALAWSPDGTQLAASGGAHLFIWNVATSHLVTAIALPPHPMTDLYVFDAATGALVMSAPATIFMPSGYAHWLPSGQIHSATRASAGSIALWHGPGGTRIFHDATTNTVDIGMDDADAQAHAAFVRWSPDGRYLLWGYPRLPIMAHAATLGAVTAPDATLAALVSAVDATHDPAASIIVWPSPDGMRYAALDGTRATPRIALYDATHGTLRAILATENALPGMLAWQPGATPVLGLAASAAGVTRYGTR